MHSNFDQRQDQGRDPEDRKAHGEDEKREKALDKTLADSFPTSDPPSISDPANPSVDSDAENSHRELLMGLPAGSWAAISLEDHKLPLADSIVYATAGLVEGVLWTQDDDFDGLPDVKFYPKKPRP